jgi:hypothetical protein
MLWRALVCCALARAFVIELELDGADRSLRFEAGDDLGVLAEAWSEANPTASGNGCEDNLGVAGRMRCVAARLERAMARLLRRG